MKNFIGFNPREKIVLISLFFAVSLFSSDFEPDWRFTSKYIYASFGISVSGAGDVNGDGFDDIIAGAPYFTEEEAFEGAAFVFYGGEQGLPSDPDWSWQSDQEDAYFGFSVSMAGDVNGDGFDDIIIGSPRFDGGFWNQGKVFVFYGSSEGLPPTPSWTSEIKGEEIFFGLSVSGAGDVNGDGFDDVVAGSPNYSQLEEYEGGIFVYFGSSSGLEDEPNWTYVSGQEWAFLGHSVSSAGDLNGDGLSDIIAGAPFFNFEENEYGAALVFYGNAEGLSNSPDWKAMPIQIGAEYGTSVSTAGDADDDGFDEIIIGAPMFNGTKSWEGAGFVFTGQKEGLSDLLGWSFSSGVENSIFGYSVSSAGDINGDGFHDVIVGAHDYSNGEHFEGAVYVFWGSPSGLQTSRHELIESGIEEAKLGVSVSGAGDVNGDGYDDIIAGAYGIMGEDNSQGAIFVWLGSESGL
ncbi:FG-GAP repeat protein [candidate division WOR-3 bacterium]|nr:FG-GAP repeat protein [candidate division WOR-3 bacterium]